MIQAAEMVRNTLPEHIRHFFARLSWHGYVSGTDDYTGIDFPIGIDFGNYSHNTLLAATQLKFALLLGTSEIVDDAIYNKVFNLPSLDFDRLAEEQILQGKRFLDMGQGLIPSFARITRYLGADTYTVSKEPADAFEYLTRHFEEPWISLEREKHLQLDLRGDPVQSLLEHTSGDLDLVTSAHLTISNTQKLDIAHALLQEQGVHYDADYWKIFHRKGEGPHLP